MFGSFRKKKKTIGDSPRFNAVDGLHHATIKDDGIVSLQMIDVLNIKKKSVDYTFLDTGSHHVQIVDDLENYNVKNKVLPFDTVSYTESKEVISIL
jgi:diaminopimelate epimerase